MLLFISSDQWQYWIGSLISNVANDSMPICLAHHPLGPMTMLCSSNFSSDNDEKRIMEVMELNSGLRLFDIPCFESIPLAVLER